MWPEIEEDWRNEVIVFNGYSRIGSNGLSLQRIRCILRSFSFTQIIRYILAIWAVKQNLNILIEIKISNKSFWRLGPISNALFKDKFPFDDEEALNTTRTGENWLSMCTTCWCGMKYRRIWWYRTEKKNYYSISLETGKALTLLWII